MWRFAQQPQLRYPSLTMFTTAVPYSHPITVQPGREQIMEEIEMLSMEMEAKLAKEGEEFEKVDGDVREDSEADALSQAGPDGYELVSMDIEDPPGPAQAAPLVWPFSGLQQLQPPPLLQSLFNNPLATLGGLSLTSTAQPPEPATGTMGLFDPKADLFPKAPVVLCHGLFGFDFFGPSALPSLQVSYWGILPRELELAKMPHYVARVPRSSHVKVRAESLLQQLSEQFPKGTELNLVGHSMGGLDCRYLASCLLGPMAPEDRPFKIRSITTLVTPHRGSSFADWVVTNLKLDSTFEARMKKLGIDLEAISCLTRDYCNNTFNPMAVDQPDILYFSYGAAADERFIQLTPLRLSFKVIKKEEGPNDGLVSVESARWGQYEETFVADHLDLIGIKPHLFVGDDDRRNLSIKLFRRILKNLHDEGC